jgi:hypothetical protein
MIECNVEVKCWEHYHGWHERATERAISLADGLLRLQIKSLPSRPEIEDLQKIQDTLWAGINLRTRQWREMVAAPYNFATKAITQNTSKPKVVGPSLEDL